MAVPYSRYLIGSIPWYSCLIILGIALTILIGLREEKRLGLPKDTMIDMAIIAVPCGIVGARLYFVLMSWDYFAQNPISILYVWEGGIAIYGAVIGGAIGVYLYARKKKLSFGKLLDIAAPGLLLAQAIGRWGNYFNMEAYGPQITDPALQFFPFGVLIGATWHMATFFYESMWSFAGFLALMLLRKKQTKPGHVFFWYLLLYGSGRFLIEQLRTDSLWIGGIRASQYLSLILCGVAAAALLWNAKKERKHALWPALCASALLLARWFALGTSAYALILCGAALALGGVTFFLPKQRERAAWLLLPLGIDIAGWLLNGIPTWGVYIHPLLCSATLPLYVGLMQMLLIPAAAVTSQGGKSL